MQSMFKSDDAILASYDDPEQRKVDAVDELRKAIAAHMTTLSALKVAKEELDTIQGDVPSAAIGEAIELAENEFGVALKALGDGRVEWG